MFEHRILLIRIGVHGSRVDFYRRGLFVESASDSSLYASFWASLIAILVVMSPSGVNSPSTF